MADNQNHIFACPDIPADFACVGVLQDFWHGYESLHRFWEMQHYSCLEHYKSMEQWISALPDSDMVSEGERDFFRSEVIEVDKELFPLFMAASVIGSAKNLVICLLEGIKQEGIQIEEESVLSLMESLDLPLNAGASLDEANLHIREALDEVSCFVSSVVLQA